MEKHFSHAAESTKSRFFVSAGLLFGLIAFAVTVPAAGHTADNDDISLSPYFQVKGAEEGVDALPLKSTQVDAVIGGPCAEVRVVQTYQNEGTVPLEARYIFPASTRAAVHGMTMTIGERRIEAQIKEKAEARKTYEQAKRAGKTASLLESHRSNVYEMNVANILPGDTVTVELRFNEMITPEEGEYEWVFPTVVGPRYSRKAPKAEPEKHDASPLDGERRLGGGIPYANAGQRGENEPVFTLTADIMAGTRVQKVKCASHSVDISKTGNGVRVTLPPREGVAMNRDFVLRYRLEGEALAGGLLMDTFKGEKYFLLTVQPPRRVERAQVPPCDYVFVMDVSGSMWGFPLDVAKRLLKEMLINLRDTDTFNVLLFSGSSRTLFEAPVAATSENIAAALALFESRDGYEDYGGGTELLPALKRAFALPRANTTGARNIVVVTDGYVDVEAEAYALVFKNIGDANLFAFGIGSSVNRELIERLARAGRTDPIVVEDERRAKGAAEKLRRMIESPVLTNVRATFNGGTVAVPDVLAQRPMVMLGKWPQHSDPSTQVIQLSGQTSTGSWSAEIKAADAIDMGEQGLLALFWAREQLRELLDLHALRADAPKQKAAIIELGLKYNLLTPFTSFVAVDMTPRLSEQAAEQAKKVTQALPLPEGVSELAVGMSGDDGNSVPTTPEPETIGLMIVAAMVVAVVAWRKHGAKMRKGVV